MTTDAPLLDALRPLVERLVDERLAALRGPDADLSPRAAAELAGVDVETIRRWVRSALERLLAGGPRRRGLSASASPEALADRDFR